MRKDWRKINKHQVACRLDQETSEGLAALAEGMGITRTTLAKSMIAECVKECLNMAKQGEADAS